MTYPLLRFLVHGAALLTAERGLSSLARADASLAREAIARGMHETDTVVQRRLATQLPLRAAAAVRGE